MYKNYDDECDICKIFSNSSRLMVLESLRNKSLNVNEIVNKTSLPQSVVSQSLSMMRLRGILNTERKGSFVFYSIKYPEILDAFDIIRKIKNKIQNK